MTRWRRLTLGGVALLLAAGCSAAGDGAAGGAREDAAPPAAAPASSPPAPRAPAAGPSTYLALGDSVAAGTGAPTAGTGYVPVLADLLGERLGCGDAAPAGCPLRVVNLAESGATAASLRRSQLPRALEVLEDAPQVRLITVTIGGNDVFEPVVRACAAAPRSPTCRSTVVATLERAGAGVDAVLSELAAAAPAGTTIALMTYYDPLRACQLAALQPLAARVLEGDGAQPGLNDVLRERAAEHGVRVVETGDRLRSDADFVGDDDCLHPSGQGHRRIAEAFLDAVGDELPRS